MKYNDLEVGNRSVQVQAAIFETMATNANLKYWSQDALEELYKGTAEMIQEIKPDKRFKKFVQKTRVTYNTIWNTILKSEGKGLLHGFGVSNRFGDRMWGNPERSSIL
jgi:hypothetical protein